MTADDVVDEWTRRRRRLQVMHALMLVVLGGLFVGYVFMPPAVSEFIESWSLPLVLGVVALYIVSWARVCKCPNCGRYPGGKVMIDRNDRLNRRFGGVYFFRKGAFDYPSCAHCGTDLVRS